MKFDVITDSGHGWVKVPVSLLHELQIEGKISACSYMRKQSGKNPAWYAYLEEDCDASLFFAACQQAGLPVTYRERNCSRSRIRNYETYSAGRI